MLGLPPKLVSISTSPPYFLTVGFEDGVRRTFDCIGLLSGPLFEPLRDPAYFARVTIDEFGSSVMWPNEADLAPEFLYYGPTADEPWPDTQLPIAANHPEDHLIPEKPSWT